MERSIYHQLLPIYLSILDKTLNYQCKNTTESSKNLKKNKTIKNKIKLKEKNNTD
ncbi:hypothetical protein Catovirus_1_832 [Catovirus CTV1]|uniref:Uncharacterized protein n=1 Tax=Catovirus CTV1 TaxID=1977631 RepID=A0A1V0SAP2_9VIRU|nr:hypothetical protein Catovirus_1_832 [Catovirus CTV1]